MKEAIDKTIQVLRAGGVILYPTDTVWGLGCDATNAEAVEKIFRIKQRAESKSLVTMVSGDGMLQRFVKQVPEMAWQLIDITATPLTIVYDDSIGLAKNVLAEDGSVGIRMVKHDFCQQLIHKFNKPIVSTSANISGEATPLDYSSIVQAIKDQVDYIVPASYAGKPSGKPSAIIKLQVNGEIKIIRN